MKLALPNALRFSSEALLRPPPTTRGNMLGGGRSAQGLVCCKRWLGSYLRICQKRHTLGDGRVGEAAGLAPWRDQDPALFRGSTRGGPPPLRWRRRAGGRPGSPPPPRGGGALGPPPPPPPCQTPGRGWREAQ